MKAGYYEKLPRAEYDQIEAMNYSNLKYMERSPFAFRFHRDNPTPPTAPMILGNHAHTAILEPEMYQFAVYDGRRDPRIHAYQDWLFANQGKIHLSVKEEQYIRGMVEAVHANPIAHKYLRFGKKELTMVWRDASLNRLFKGRPDNFVEMGEDDKPVLVSLKSTVDCRDFRFGAQYAKLGYHAQDALYQNGFFQLGHELPRMVCIAVENKPPHETAVYNIPIDALRLGAQLISKWALRLAECERTNTWPTAMEGEQDLQLPSWAYPDGDFQFDDLEPISE